MVITFIGGGPQDGLIVDNAPDTSYEWRFPAPVEIKALSPNQIVLTDPASKSYVYYRYHNSDKFTYAGVK